METPRDRDDQMAADLRALRPKPAPEFAAELDERAAAGFPRRSRLPRFSFGPLSAFPARRLALAGGAFALFAIVVASTLIVANQGEPERQGNLALLEPKREPATPSPEPPDKAATGGGANAPQESAGTQYESDIPTVASEASSGSSSAGGSVYGAAAPEAEDLEVERTSAKPDRRAVERSAEIVLAAEPGDVSEDSSEVFEVVHAHDGIVMRSSSREGKPGRAGARFELLLPSENLGDALAALSAIDEVRSRHEATTDITAPTVDTAELLRDSRARIDSLLAQLESAETEGEREAVEAELQQERRHRARLRGSLQRLEHRASYSRVLLLIETGAEEEPDSGGGAWGVGDALGDAGQILAVAAAVAVVGLAILGPIALIALLAWLAHRAWVRRERRRVLS